MTLAVGIAHRELCGGAAHRALQLAASLAVLPCNGNKHGKNESRLGGVFYFVKVTSNTRGATPSMLTIVCARAAQLEFELGRVTAPPC